LFYLSFFLSLSLTTSIFLH
jgi:ubiquitin carboxyl-terminal hydrolase 10